MNDPMLPAPELMYLTAAETRYYRLIESRQPDPVSSGYDGWEVLDLACGHRQLVHGLPQGRVYYYCAECMRRDILGSVTQKIEEQKPSSSEAPSDAPSEAPSDAPAKPQPSSSDAQLGEGYAISEEWLRRRAAEEDNCITSVGGLVTDMARAAQGEGSDEAYPNLQALADGRVSGRISEWPLLRVEARKALAKLQQRSS